MNQTIDQHPDGSSKLRFPDYMTTAQDGGKVVSLTHRPPLPPGNAPGTHFCWRLSRPQGHSAIGRIMSMKNSSNTIWNRTSELPICSAVPRSPHFIILLFITLTLHFSTLLCHLQGARSQYLLSIWTPYFKLYVCFVVNNLKLFKILQLSSYNKIILSLNS
jgi:hypothetical protein